MKDPIGIVEAAYAFDAPDEGAWLARLTEVVRDNLPSPPVAIAYAYRIEKRGDAPWIAPRSVTTVGASPEMGAAFLQPPPFEPSAFARMQTLLTAYHRSTGLRSGLAFVDSNPDMAGVARFYRQMFESQGFGDVLTLTVADPTTDGCVLVLPVRTPLALAAARRASWQRVAAHVCAGFRLRRKIETMRGAATEEAILSPSGKVEHATGDATEAGNRRAFREAVLSAERSRGSLRKKAPEEALELWRGLVSGRWTLLDRFESDGRRYLVAHRNDPEVPDPRALTDRERQVVGYAVLGQSNKMIAYNLGIATSTVGVLLGRAAAKLGVKSRAELLATYPTPASVAGPPGGGDA